MKHYNLAQVNIAKALAPMDNPIMADFVNNLDRINALAEQSEGFVWRLVDENSNDATSLKVFDDEFIVVNMSIWESMEALFNFTYKSEHVQIFARRKEWFHNIKEMHMAFWYIEEGKVATPFEAKERLAYLNKHGETPYAFTFKSKFTIADAMDYNPITQEP